MNEYKLYTDVTDVIILHLFGHNITPIRKVN